MVLLTRIYTKSGDKGRTSLGDSTRISKAHPRMDTIGTVDEANAYIGVCRAHAADHPQCDEILRHIQHDLFDIGADLCMPQTDSSESSEHPPLRINADQVLYLETTLDHLNIDLAPLQSFVLPGGRTLSSYLHVARTIVRRAERQAVALSETEALNTCVIQYLNRLSDLLFVMARYVNDKGSRDVLWVPGVNR